MITLPKHAELWLPAHLKDSWRPKTHAKRIWVTLADHYEPMGGVTLAVALQRVAKWEQKWPQIADAAPMDSKGRKPCFTFFYPQEEYHPSILSRLAEIVRTGIADVEVHIHHFNETADSFREKMRTFCGRLHDEHGLLRKDEGRIVFGFIHGNWALDNSLPQGKWCGLTGELQLLKELGCYADFTMPSIPSASQSKIINRLYWATGSPHHNRGFDTGIEARPGGGQHGTMLMVTGPVGLRYDRPGLRRPWPRIETGELAANDPPTKYRVERWLDLCPRVGQDIFIKLYGHSARELNADTLLGRGSEEGSLLPMFRWIHEAAEERGLELNWVSAYEMYLAIRNITDTSN